jgi:hypothetical protein
MHRGIYAAGLILVMTALPGSGMKVHAQDFYHVMPPDAGETREVLFHGIPFRVEDTEKGYRNMFAGRYEVNETCIEKPVHAVFFLGMVTEKPEASEWWGPTERWYAFNNRLFIGDQLGKIFIVYRDTTVDVIPIIFGVNLWNYELLSRTRKSEGYLNTYGGPYPEPFQSDMQAKSTLDASLHLMENDTVKGGRYILGIRTRNKPVARIWLDNDHLRTAGVYITAVTCMTGKQEMDPEWEMVDARFFNRKEFYPAMDLLARRLYQFRDELPAEDPFRPPPAYQGPVVKFSGTALAEIFTNVYAHNIQDMQTKKVGPDGSMHTSSGDLPNFGIYIGMGTFKEQSGSYHSMVWTRDVGRCMVEVIESGEAVRSAKAGQEALRLLYDPSARFKQPNWKRIANASELHNESLWVSVGGKENDGHAAMMMFLYKLIQHRCVNGQWLKKNWRALCDAAEWYCWQMDHPSRSGFDGVLSSETEASTQQNGCFDLYSNYYAYMGLKAFVRLAGWVDDNERGRKWNDYADRLLEGIMSAFTTMHPRYGRIFVDNTYDCWTWEYKRFIPLFLAPDFNSYDLARDDPELYRLCQNTYLAQKEDFFSYASGRQMGYGQGFITQASILLDETEDMKGYLEQAAAFCYHHSDYKYIVPEGVIMHPSGRFWFRNCDLGNNVQQAEIIKCARLILGLDDLHPERGLNIIPRLPATWSSIQAEDYPVVAAGKDGKVFRTSISYQYQRLDGGYRLTVEPRDPIRLGRVRIGPFPTEQVEIREGDWPYEFFHLKEQVYLYIDLGSHEDGRLEIQVAHIGQQ